MIHRIVIFIVVVLIFEFLAFRGLIKLIEKKKRRKIFIYFYWILSLLILMTSIAYYVYNQWLNVPDYIKVRSFFNISTISMLNLFPKIILSVFSTIDDIIVFLIFVIKRIMKRKVIKMPLYKARRVFLYSGLLLALFLFGNIIYGMAWGKNDLEIKRITISSEKLPQSFNGFKIAQISDFHLGSFKDKQLVENCIALLVAEKPDVILFTGDMVNNEAVEALPYISLFKKLAPPYGMFSILGNHDMGDYRLWYSDREKSCNLNDLVRIQQEMGFEMMRNKHTYFVSGNDSIALIGVDNWGVPPFKKYGDLKKAMQGVNRNLFTILLSHDPSHWNQEVTDKTNIDLTLSGHTHGGQMVFKMGNYTFSPVQWKYKQWMGLYNDKKQYLYVNTGIGFIGFKGRIGVKPEITMITLKSLPKI